MKNRSIMLGLCLLLTTPLSSALESGAIVGKNIFGLAHDYQKMPLMIGEDPLIYESAASHTNVELNESKFTVSLFDHLIGSVFVTSLNDKGVTVDTHYVDTSAVFGIAQPTAPIQTLWNSVIFSEDTAPNGISSDDFTQDFQSYFKQKENMVNPYHYGWLAETIILDAQGATKVIKNYSVGRVAADELALMPDGKTIYLLDNNQSGNLYLFLADEVNSLSAGTLYHVSIQEDKAVYTELGKGDALRMKYKLKKAKFSTFFKQAPLKDGGCGKGYTLTASYYGQECLKLNKRNKKYVGLFEPARASALKGLPSFSKDNTEMHFDKNSNTLVFSNIDNQPLTLTLSNKADTSIASNFLIEVKK